MFELGYGIGVSPWPQTRFISWESQSKTLLLENGFGCQLSELVLWMKNLALPNMKFLNWIQSIINLIPLCNNSLNLFYSVLFRNLWGLSLHQNRDSPKYPESCYQKWFISIIKMAFFRNYSIIFLHDSHNQKPSFLKTRPDCIFKQLVLWMEIRTLPNKILFVFTRYSISHLIVIRGLVSSRSISNENLKLIEEWLIQKPLMFILAWKSWLSKISRKLLSKMIYLDYRKGVSP